MKIYSVALVVVTLAMPTPPTLHQGWSLLTGLAQTRFRS